MRNCITIIVHDKIPIMRQQKGILGKKKIILRELSSKQTRKSKLLVQQDGNILKTILSTVLNVPTQL